MVLELCACEALRNILAHPYYAFHCSVGMLWRTIGIAKRQCVCGMSICHYDMAIDRVRVCVCGWATGNIMSIADRQSGQTPL